MGANFSLCGTCNANAEFNEKKNEEDKYITEIKVKSSILMTKMEFLEKSFNESKINLKEDILNNKELVNVNRITIVDNRTEVKREIVELKNDMMVLINIIEKHNENRNHN